MHCEQDQVLLVDGLLEPSAGQSSSLFPPRNVGGGCPRAAEDVSSPSSTKTYWESSKPSSSTSSAASLATLPTIPSVVRTFIPRWCCEEFVKMAATVPRVSCPVVWCCFCTTHTLCPILIEARLVAVDILAVVVVRGTKNLLFFSQPTKHKYLSPPALSKANGSARVLPMDIGKVPKDYPEVH